MNHDNIARVYYAGSQGGLYFIAYEFASGRTIRDLIVESGRLSPLDTINYAIQVTLALNHTAAAGIVHRDIKPSNIMLTTSGRVKVVDLGLARRETTDSIGDITVAGTTLGTFDYIAPGTSASPERRRTQRYLFPWLHNVPHADGTTSLSGRHGPAEITRSSGQISPDPRTLNTSVPEEIAAIMQDDG